MNLNVNKLIEYPKEGIASKVVKGTKKFDITLFCMTGRTEIGEHTSTRQGIVYVLEGKGIFNLEGKNIKMEQGKLIFMNKNARHSLKAKKNTAFLLMLFK